LLGSPTEWPARPDPLQPAADRARRLDLDDEIDGTHVDPELEAARRDDAAQHAPLELVLDHDPLLTRERPVVRLHEIDGRDWAPLCVACSLHAARRWYSLRRIPACIDLDGVAVHVVVELVQLRGEALGLPSGVREDDRRAVLEDLWRMRG
jgi:hypothetical protein